MGTFGIILSLSSLLGVAMGDWRDWGKSESEKNYEYQELGGGKFAWVVTKIGGIISWFSILFFLYLILAIIKILWKLA